MRKTTLFYLFEHWVESVNEKEVSAFGVEAQIQRSFILCIIMTVFAAASAGMLIVAFVLHKRPFEKIVDACGLMLELLMIPVLWQFYYWVKRRAMERARRLTQSRLEYGTRGEIF